MIKLGLRKLTRDKGMIQTSLKLIWLLWECDILSWGIWRVTHFVGDVNNVSILH